MTNQSFFLSLIMLTQCLSDFDPELHSLIQQESHKQDYTINLIASENITPFGVSQVMSSVLTNKYSEGYPGKRYYGGTQIIDKVEMLCQKRALELFNLDSEVWGVNVQALSGSAANLAVYTALIRPNGKLLGMDLPSGGHLTHGYQSVNKKISASSLFFQSDSYKVDRDNLLNYNDIKLKYNEFKPDIFVCGYSAYSRDIDYKKLREIVGECYLMADIAHTSGLIACKLLNNPFVYCDVITTTTHKTLRGPRGALIYYRKKKVVDGVEVNIEDKINFSVFPCLQGGPHNNAIAGIAVALKMAKTEEYKKYCQQVVLNARAMSDELIRKGYNVLTSGTDNHLVLVDLSNIISGSEAEMVCEMANIIINKNATPNSKSPFNPKGVRLGTPALTTRGLREKEFVRVVEFFDRAIQIGVQIRKNLNNGGNFSEAVKNSKETKELKEDVINLVKEFPIPCYDYKLNKSANRSINEIRFNASGSTSNSEK